MKQQSGWYQDLKLIRLISFIPKRTIEVIRNLQYRKSPDSLALKKIKDQYSGKRCYIIGNGPSLNVEDLEKLENSYTFGVNKVYHIFSETAWRPTFYVCVDNRAVEECYEAMSKYAITSFFDIAVTKCRNFQHHENMMLVQNRQRFYVNRFCESTLPRFSQDASKGIEAGETVVYNAIQLAVYMGFSEIVLLGVDCDYSKVFASNRKVLKLKEGSSYFSSKLDANNENVANLIGQMNAFRSAKQNCDKLGVQVYNATHGGKLEVFKRIHLDVLVK